MREGGENGKRVKEEGADGDKARGNPKRRGRITIQESVTKRRGLRMVQQEEPQRKAGGGRKVA